MADHEPVAGEASTIEPARLLIDNKLRLSLTFNGVNKRQHLKRKATDRLCIPDGMEVFEDSYHGYKKSKRTTSVSSTESSVQESRLALLHPRSASGTKVVTNHQEGEVLVGLNTEDIDNLPCHLLTDVNVIALPTLAGGNDFLYRSILHQAQPGSNLKVVGTLIIDEENEGQLIKRQGKNPIDLNNNKRITLDNVQMFSIGYTSDDKTFQLWVLGQAGWYEIAPSLDYRDIYQDQMKAIALRFTIENFYFDSKDKKVYDTIEEEALAVLELCSGINSGDGDLISDWVMRCRNYQSFILSQMERMDVEHPGSGVVVKASPLYRWFKRGSFNLPPLPQRYASEPHPVVYEDAGSSDGDDSDGDEDYVYEDAPPDNDIVSGGVGEFVDRPDTISPSGGRLSMTSPWHQAYTSPTFLRGSEPGSGFTKLVAALICHMDFAKRAPKPDKVTLAQIQYLVYKDLNVGKELKPCKSLVSYFGHDIAQELPEKFKLYDFWPDLVRPRQPSQHYEDYNTYKTDSNGAFVLDEHGRRMTYKLGKNNCKRFLKLKDIVESEGVEGSEQRICRRRKIDDKGGRKKMVARRNASKQLAVLNRATSEPQIRRHSDRIAALPAHITNIMEPSLEQTRVDNLSQNQASRYLVREILEAGEAVMGPLGNTGESPAPNDAVDASSDHGPL